jgi:type II restriction/modification system DNA methylase subunit YeeA
MSYSKLSSNSIPNFYSASTADFKKIPGNPIAYWVSDSVRLTFSLPSNLKNIANPNQALVTGNTERYIRRWQEVNYNNIGFGYADRKSAINSRKKWFPYNKGGDFRQWYGNNEHVLNWENDGYELQNTLHPSGTRIWAHNFVLEFIFKKAIVWSKITSNKPCFRLSDDGFLYDDASGVCPVKQGKEEFLIGFLASKVAYTLELLINPTLNIQPGNLDILPLVEEHEETGTVVKRILLLSRTDWDSYETSWDFTTLLLLQPEYHHQTLRETYIKLRTRWKEMTMEMQQLEEENNRIFIEAYGLQDELTPEVPLSEITLTCNPYYRYNGNRSEEELEALLLTDTIKEFISYAVGCMFGRYSLDKPGLVLANQGEKIGDYLEQVPDPSFMPDADNIIPILEDEYFEDDIVGRFKEFLKVTFGEDTLSENLDFIAEALGSNGKKSSEAVLRDYFLRSFYKDHVKMYKKRPIYWLFSSGKGKAFNALIYMHRYNKETLAMMRTDYLLELEGKLDAKREMIKSDIGKDAQEKARLGKMIDEIMEYDELLKNKADEYIEIDLDDGVKVNYERFEGLVEKV